MRRARLVLMALSLLLAGLMGIAHAAFRASDPGVRRGDPWVGMPLPGLMAGQLWFFNAGKQAFEEAEGVMKGLGPRFNLNSCGGCYAQPASGGTSPSHNPQVDVIQTFPKNTLPSFITADGPVREARFKRKPDGRRMVGCMTCS